MKTKLKKTGPAAAQFERVESGIFRYIPSGVYYERPKINGRRTWRSLETANLKYAREELHRRRSGMVEREAQQAKKPKVTVGEIVRRYVQDGYPDRQKQPRQGPPRRASGSRSAGRCPRARDGRGSCRRR